MKNKKQRLLLITLVIGISLVQSCGPVVISSRPDTPPPPWFYPNRVETVRYVYFPEHMIYYDLFLRNYIYLNNGTWVRVRTLPQRYNGINLRRSRFVRIRDYRSDNISRYHRENNSATRRSSRRTKTESRRN